MLNRSSINWHLVTHFELVRQPSAGDSTPVPVYEVHFVGGDSVQVATADDPSAAIEVEAVVPAEPGYSVVPVIESDEDEATLWTSPIIAWRVRSEWPQPVCIDELPADERYAIVHPNGVVVEQGVTTFPNVHAWCAEGKRRALARDGRQARA